MPVAALESYAVLLVDEVDLINRLAHCLDKTNSHVPASFRTNGAGGFYIPTQSEKWLALKIGNMWHLQQRLDSTDNHTMIKDQMRRGDYRVLSGDGGRLFVEAPVVSGPSTAKRILGF